MLCYEFTFVIQIVEPLFRWFLAISLVSDIQRDGSGKMLRAKSDCWLFLQKFCTNSDGEQFWNIEQATGLHEVGIRQLPLQLQHHGNQRRADSSTKCFHPTQSTSWYSAEVSAFVFISFRRTHIGEYIRDDIDHQILFLPNSGRYYMVFTVDTGPFSLWEGEPANNN